MNRHWLLVPCLTIGFAAAAVPQTRAQDYPNRQVTVVVPFTPAGTTDILGRMFAQRLEARLGKPFVVENKPGAGMQIGTTAVAKAAPDGYTLLIATSSAMAVNPTLYKKLPYDTMADFQAIAMLAHLPFILVVNPSLPVNNLAEFIKYAKERPGQLSFGSGGVGASHHLYGELFNSLAGVKMTHVPYRGTVPALNDVIAGHIQVLFSDAPPALPQIQGGKVRAIGLTTAQRMPLAPEIPPIGETLPGFDSGPWQMLATRAGTPQPIVDKLNAEVRAIIASADGKKQLLDMGLIPAEPTPPAELQRFMGAEIERWGKLVQQAGAAGIE
jgi:tripartite-type tricarboxylate transporter receptor subunit TctC